MIQPNLTSPFLLIIFWIKKKWLPSKTFAILFNVMILQHIKKSSTSGSDIFFISRVCVRVCAREYVYNSFSFERKRETKETEGRKRDLSGGRRISVIVDFVNPSRSFQRRVERRVKPKISKTKNILVCVSHPRKKNVHDSRSPCSSTRFQVYHFLASMHEKRKKKLFSLQFKTERNSVLFRGKLNSNVPRLRILPMLSIKLLYNFWITRDWCRDVFCFPFFFPFSSFFSTRENKRARRAR